MTPSVDEGKIRRGAVACRTAHTGALIVAAVLVVAVATIHADVARSPSTRGEQAATLEADQELLARADAARRMGPPSAVVVEEFFDYACPTCAEFHRRSGADLEAFVEREQISFVAHPYPLPRLMRGFQAAEAALCVGALGGSEAFFDMHGRVLAGLEEWRPLLDPRPVLAGYAEQSGVDMSAWQDCVDRDAMAPLILADQGVARARRITGTPTFIFRRSDSELISAVLSNADAFAGFAQALERTRR
jgi:protein-disulfide isomerase